MKNYINSYRLSNYEILLINKIKKVYLENGFGFEMLPEIYFCNFHEAQMIFEIRENETSEEENFFFNPDFLGVYKYSVLEEGVIILYRDRIINTASRIFTKNPKVFESVDEVIKLLKTKVLIHEIGHWLTHFCSIIYKSEIMKNFPFLPKIIIESMAQLTVLWCCENNTTEYEYKFEQFARIFFPMQPYPYYEFRKIHHIHSPEIIIKRFWGITSLPTHLNKDILFDLLCKKESDLSDLDKIILGGKSV